MSTEEDPPIHHRPWGPVDPSIWDPGPRKAMLQQVVARLRDTASSVSIVAFTVAGPLSFLLSLLLVYDVAGPVLFGPVLLTFWGIIIIGVVLLLEKTGYSRNFEKWEFRLSPAKVLAIPVSFFIIVGAFYILILLRPH